MTLVSGPFQSVMVSYWNFVLGHLGQVGFFIIFLSSLHAASMLYPRRHDEFLNFILARIDFRRKFAIMFLWLKLGWSNAGANAGLLRLPLIHKPNTDGLIIPSRFNPAK
jgi:hypothetical protein